VPSRERERLIQIALTGVLLVVTMLLGLAGQALIAYFFGAGTRSDALFFARDTSDLAAKALLGTQAAGVLVPLLLAVKGRSGMQAADRALAAILALVVLVGVMLVGLVEAGADVLVSALAPGFSDASADLAVTLLRIVAPMAPATVVSTLAVAALQARGRFGRAQLVNVAGGVALLAAMPVLIHLWGVRGAAAGMLVGAVVQALAGWAFLVLEGVPRVVAPWAAREEVREFVRRTVPFVGYAAASQGSGVVLRIALSTLAAGGYAAYALGSRLYRSVFSLLLTPVQQVLFPALAHSEAADRRDEADAELIATLRYATFVTVPVGVALCALSAQSVSLVFERGQFDAADTHRTAVVLAVMSLAIVPTGLYVLLEQAAYARARGRLIVRINVAIEAVQAALYLPLALWVGAGGVAAASVVAVAFAATAYLNTLRPEGGAFATHRAYGVRLLGCALTMLVAMVLVTQAVEALLEPGRGLAQAMVLLPATAVGATIYVATARALGLSEPSRLGELAFDFVRRRGDQRL